MPDVTSTLITASTRLPVGPLPPAGQAASTEHASVPVELILQARNGCPDAFACLVERYTPPVFHYLHRMIGHAQDAEDLTQETFLKAHRSLSSFRSAQAFPSWLFTIARRTALNHLRSRRRTEEVDAEHPADDPDPSAAAQAADAWNSLWQLADQLPADQREVLWLRYAEDLSIRDVARVTGRTALHVRVLLHRARRQLLKKLRSPDTDLPRKEAL